MESRPLPPPPLKLLEKPVRPRAGLEPRPAPARAWWQRWFAWGASRPG
jgi:hypothetical protein